MCTIITLPQRRAVAFVEKHEVLDTFDIMVRWSDDRVARITGNFRDEIEALEVGQSLALSNGWAFDGKRCE